LIHYINEKKEQSDELSRQELLEEFKDFHGTSTLDVYRRILTVLEYIEVATTGHYIILKRIPEELTTSQAVFEAYGI